MRDRVPPSAAPAFPPPPACLASSRLDKDSFLESADCRSPAIVRRFKSSVDAARGMYRSPSFNFHFLRFDPLLLLPLFEVGVIVAGVDIAVEFPVLLLVLVGVLSAIASASSSAKRASPPDSVCVRASVFMFTFFPITPPFRSPADCFCFRNCDADPIEFSSVDVAAIFHFRNELSDLVSPLPLLLLLVVEVVVLLVLLLLLVVVGVVVLLSLLSCWGERRELSAAPRDESFFWLGREPGSVDAFQVVRMRLRKPLPSPSSP